MATLNRSVPILLPADGVTAIQITTQEEYQKGLNKPLVYFKVNFTAPGGAFSITISPASSAVSVCAMRPSPSTR